MINSVKIMSRMGRMRSYFLLEEVNKYLNAINLISNKAEILSCWTGDRIKDFSRLRIPGLRSGLVMRSHLPFDLKNGKTSGNIFWKFRPLSHVIL